VSVRVENSFSSSRDGMGWDGMGWLLSLLVCRRRQDGVSFACGHSFQESDVSFAPLLRSSRSREFLMLENEMNMYLYSKGYTRLTSMFVVAVHVVA
jgi:hypothetical protein